MPQFAKDHLNRITIALAMRSLLLRTISVRHAVVAAACKLALVLAILPALAEAATSSREGSESEKASVESEYECTIEQRRRVNVSSQLISGKQLHPTRLSVCKFEQNSYSAQAHGHFLPNGLCAPRLC